ncbi:hypothetical protein AO920_32885 [Pseudomonas aeruginosa]|nr:hypothetical protein A214_22005 [Pseudomonas aeruginosa SJTD-1]EZP23712.1 hypothetical protein V550_01610 [Pseudomonas aeruginosa BWH049]KAA5628434.1 hypothetical protein F3H11_12860 [Pseudomonas aeruginosa]KAA5642256.1 hypothetical protein F3G63_22030 [Pseudomonas aeruginosa]KAB5472074.1 hypothetical protein F8137_02670 [Pseudomonas aeruginosa]
MEWQAVSLEGARRGVGAGIGCRRGGECLRISAVSECLRAVSHLCSAPKGSQGAWEPAASVRLSGMVRRKLVSLWPNLAADGVDTQPGVIGILNSLADLGDMVRLEGGKWLAAPAHTVRAGDGLAVLLGGGPKEILPQAVRASAKAEGRVRLVETAACEGWADMWEAEEWIGAPAEGLEAWSARLLAEATSRLTDAPDDMGEVSVYLPREWVRLTDLPAGEGSILLCRVRSSGVAGPMFSYFIGEFVRGRLRRLSGIDSKDARRFRFHLDARAGRSIRVVASVSQGSVKLRLGRRLPEREARVLLLGWQVPAPDGGHPGVTHHMFPVETLPILRKAFEGLRIVLDERLDAGREN